MNSDIVIVPIAPSETALQRAAELGREMARKVYCHPEMSMASYYDTYIRFRNALRERMEHSEAFSQRWLERIFAIAEKEGSGAGLRLNDSMASWDLWYNKIVVPLKELFWHSWEHSFDLPAHYAEARQMVCEIVETPTVLRVAAQRAEAQPTAPNLTELGMAQALSPSLGLTGNAGRQPAQDNDSQTEEQSGLSLLSGLLNIKGSRWEMPGAVLSF